MQSTQRTASCTGDRVIRDHGHQWLHADDDSRCLAPFDPRLLSLSAFAPTGWRAVYADCGQPDGIFVAPIVAFGVGETCDGARSILPLVSNGGQIEEAELADNYVGTAAPDDALDTLIAEAKRSIYHPAVVA